MLFHIIECVSPKVEVLTAVDGCSAYIYRLPTIGLGIPLISGEFNIHRFRTSVVSIAFIIPVNRNGFVHQFNVTGDDGAILVTRRIICAIKVLGCIVVLIVLSCLVVISNRSGIGDCLTIKVLLIVSPSISPYVSVIGNSANSRVSAYNASTGVVTQKILYSLTVSIQVQCYCTRTNTVVIAVVIPLDGELNIVASCNQVMLEIDITCIQRSVIVNSVRVCGRYCIIITRCGRAFNLTGSCSGVIDGMSDPLCIVITHKDQLVSDLFGRCIRCGNRKISKGHRLLIVPIVIKSLLTYYLVGDGRYQTNRYTLRTATIIVLKIRPLNSCSISGVLLVPLSVKIQNPVVSILLGVGRVKLQAICYFIVSVRSASPTRKRLTRCICHICQNMKQLIIVIRLSLDKTSALAGIVVVYLYFLSDPLCIEGLILGCLGIGRKRCRACLIRIPAVKLIAGTSRGCPRSNGFIILLGRRGSTGATISVPCKGYIVCFPYAVYGVLSFVRLPTLIDIWSCCIRSRCPTQEGITLARRVLRELERQLCGICFFLTIYRNCPFKFTSSTINCRHTGARQIIIKISDVHIAVAHLRWIGRLNDNVPLSIINLVGTLGDNCIAR